MIRRLAGWLLLTAFLGRAASAEAVRAFQVPEGAKAEDPAGWRELEAAGVLNAGAALQNDKIRVLVLPGSSGATIRSVKADVKSGISLQFLTKGAAGKIARIELVKKGKSEAVLRVATNLNSVDLKLAPGQPFVEIVPLDGTDAVEVHGKTRYAVLPDFFGYDTVYDPKRLKAPSLVAPAENFLLGLEDGSDAVVMCVWQGAHAQGAKKDESARDPRVNLYLNGEGADRVVERMRIECVAGHSLYVSFLAGAGIWFDQDTSTWEAQKPTELAWNRPFEAKWRVNFLGKEGAWSKDMFSRNLTYDAIYRDAPMRWNGDIPMQSIQGLWPYFICPFWIVNNKAYLALYADMSERKRVEGKKDMYPKNNYERAVIYPLDRRKETPNTELTLVDVMRETLGQAPCEYVLDVEGIQARPSGGTRETLGATCGIYENHIQKYIEAVKGKDTDYKIGEKRLMALKPGEKLAPEFEARLVQALEDMSLFVSAVLGRISEYKNFSDKLAAICEEEGKRSSQIKPLADKVLEKAKQLQHRSADQLPAMTKQRDDWVAKMAQLVAEVKSGKYANLSTAGPIRDYAVTQDIYVAFARRFVKAVREEVSAVESSDPEVIAFAARLRGLSHEILRKKHSMEGW